MGKVRKVVIAVAAVLMAGAVAVSVYNKIKADKLKHTVWIEDALINNTPQIGDELYLEYAAGDLYKVKDGLWTWSGDYPGDEEKYIIVPVLAGDEIERATMLYAEVKAPDPDLPDVIAQNFREYYQDLIERLIAKREEDLAADPEASTEKIDGLIKMMEELLTDERYVEEKSSVAPYVLEASGLPDYGLVSYVSGGIAVLLGIVLLYSVLGIWLSGKKLAIGSLALVIISIVACAVLFRKELMTMLSIRKYSPDFYLCNMQNDYKLDEILATDIRDTDSMIEVGSKKLLGGYPISTDAHHFACSSFSCVTEEGTHLLGRNYDYKTTSGLILYSDQEGSYASIALCDLGWVNIAGENSFTETDSLLGRALLRGMAPYLTVDGMNDQGLGISILSLSYDENRPDTEKTDTIIIIMLRAILDKCANVDEAIALLSEYDVHSMYAFECHLFISDKSGKSVVAEWVDDELTVTEINYVTNYTIATHERDDERRFVILKDKLEEKDGVLTVDEALDLLLDASQDYEDVKTEWSCVYDLDNFVLYIYSDRDRDNIFIISPETFGI